MKLATDEIIGDGRYLLLAPFGGDERAGIEFWQAHDGVRRCDVALTVLLGSQDDQAQVAIARHVLEGVRYGEDVVHPALASVVDLPAPGKVAAGHDSVLGLVVAEWMDGVDVADGVLGARLPMALACRLLRPLVEAVDQAHHAGVVAGVDSPGRIRITMDNTAVLAFRGTAPQVTTRDDVRGLGALLYLLLTGSWPAPDRSGAVADPATLRPDVPRDLAVVAMACLGGGTGPELRTCGPLLRALDDAIAYAPPPEPPADATPPAAPAAPSSTNRTRDWRNALRRRASPSAAAPASTNRPRDWRHALRGRRLAVAGVTVAVVAGVLIGTQVAGSFGVASTTADQRSTHAVATTTREPTSTAPPTTTRPPAPPQPPAPLRPASLREFVVSGSADNPAALSRVIDGDPNTVWRTDTYQQQFPAYSPGIGVLAGFGAPRSFASVTITSISPGTAVQIRSAADPAVSLAHAPVLAAATLHDGATTIALPHQPTRYLLVWIDKLGDTDGGFRSQIGEITYQPAR